MCTDDILEAVYTSVHDNAVKGTKTNIFVAAFTTCQAPLKLYESLDTLQEQVLYYDTDSVVYKWRPNQPSIASGEAMEGFLGDMTDELDGDVITEFVSGALRTMGVELVVYLGRIVMLMSFFSHTNLLIFLGKWDNDF